MTEIPVNDNWQSVVTHWFGDESNRKEVRPKLIAVVFENDKAFLVSKELVEFAPQLLHSYGKVIGTYSDCYIIQRPKVKTRSKGARRRQIEIRNYREWALKYLDRVFTDAINRLVGLDEGEQWARITEHFQEATE